MGFPDPAEIDYVLTFRQFSEWFRASHPQTAKLDDEETRRVRAEIEGGAGGDVGKEKVGMAKRYDRYRKEYTSRQVCLSVVRYSRPSRLILSSLLFT